MFSLTARTAAVVLLVCGPIRAALPPEAQDAFDRGVRASRQGSYPEAIADLRAARQAACAKGVLDTPEVYRELGQAEAGVPGRELRAVCWLAAYLSVYPEARNAAEIKAQIGSLRQTGHGNLRRLAQLTDDVGHRVAAAERARGIVETSLDTLVVAWDQFGDFARAREVAGSIKDPYERCGAFHRVSYAQIEAGDFAGARATIGDQEKIAVLFGYPWRGEAQRDLISDTTHMAIAQAKSGDLSGARASVGKAKQTTDLLLDDSRQPEARCAVAVAQAATGDLEGALETVAMLKGEGVRAEHRIDARLAVAEAQVQAGDMAGARATIVGVRGPAGEPWVVGQGRRDVDLAPIIAALDRAGARPGDVYREIGLAQANSGDWEGAQRTVKSMAQGDGASLDATIARMAGGAPASARKITADSWLTEIEGHRMGWMLRGMDEPIFTDYFDQFQLLAAKGGDIDQKFSELQRAFDLMRMHYGQINEMLTGQFGL